jgi:glycosyltransferase involved in cell wall biosynthesis
MDKQKKSFSLLSMCWNGKKYFDDWKDSIFKQSYRPLEVLFLDDKSTDNSEDLMRQLIPEFAQNNIKLHILQHRKKLKYGNGLKYILQLASGTHFGVLDIDDALEPNSIDHVMSLYDKHPHIGYIYTQFTVCKCKNMKSTHKGFNRKPRPEHSILSEGLEGIHIYSHFRTFRRNMPDMLGVLPDGLKYAVDQFMGLSLEERAYGLFTPRLCYRYREGCKGTISSKFGGQRRQYWHKMLNRFKENREANNIKALPIIEV